MMSTRISPLWYGICLVALPVLTSPPVLSLLLALEELHCSLQSSWGRGAAGLSLSSPFPPVVFLPSMAAFCSPLCHLPYWVWSSVSLIWWNPGPLRKNMKGDGQQLSSRAGTPGLPDNFSLPHCSLIQLEGTGIVRRPGTSLFSINLFLLCKIICQSYSSYLSLMLGLFCLLFLCVYLATYIMKHETSSPRLILRGSWLGESRYSFLYPNVTFPSFRDLEFLICKQS